MGLIARVVLAALLAAASAPAALAEDAFTAIGTRAGSFADGPYGPGGVYASIPARDDRGRDQIAMFREWNPDPVGRHEANLAALDPSLARVIRKAQADNPDLSFVIGSGRRSEALQRKAFAWGWSRTRDSAHQAGRAVDLWPLDRSGHITFDPAVQGRIGAAMKRAAAELKISIRWGGGFRSFKDRDRSHFELVPGERAYPAG
jgi:peptidoglycan L-alanyl-D-glutamate endopeptidase CwlK